MLQLLSNIKFTPMIIPFLIIGIILSCCSHNACAGPLPLTINGQNNGPSHTVLDIPVGTSGVLHSVPPSSGFSGDLVVSSNGIRINRHQPTHDLRQIHTETLSKAPVEASGNEYKVIESSNNSTMASSSESSINEGTIPTSQSNPTNDQADGSSKEHWVQSSFVRISVKALIILAILVIVILFLKYFGVFKTRSE